MEPESPEVKPKRVSVPRGRALSDVDLSYAVRLLSLPRTIGSDPRSGEEVAAGIGRYGPFVRRAKTFASLGSHDDLFEIGLEQAIELLDAKDAGRRPALKELGTHPETGKPLLIFAGRYGPYVTDGSVNANVPKGTEPEDLGLEEAIELLARAAARKGAKGRPGSRRSAAAVSPQSSGSKRAKTSSRKKPSRKTTEGAPEPTAKGVRKRTRPATRPDTGES
jgi:DNA topoisomerase-1